MKKQNAESFCSVDKGEIFPRAVLIEKYYAAEHSGRASEAKFLRQSCREMLENYNRTHR